MLYNTNEFKKIIDRNAIDPDKIILMISSFLGDPIPIHMIKSRGYTVMVAVTKDNDQGKMIGLKPEDAEDFRFDDNGVEWCFTPAKELLLSLTN